MLRNIINRVLDVVDAVVDRLEPVFRAIFGTLALLLFIALCFVVAGVVVIAVTATVPGHLIAIFLTVWFALLTFKAVNG